MWQSEEASSLSKTDGNQLYTSCKIETFIIHETLVAQVPIFSFHFDVRVIITEITERHITLVEQDLL